MGKESEYSLRRTRVEIAGFVFLTFLGYLIIGLSLAVLPVFIHQTLGYNTIVAGGVISLQYVMTFLVRGYSGSIVDRKGPKPAVLQGMGTFALSGLLLALASMFTGNGFVCLVLIAVTRLVTGFAEGMIGASPVNWAMLKVGEKHTATAISFNGIASYGALAIGAPLGVVLQKWIGLSGLGGLIVLISAVGFVISMRKTAIKGDRKSQRHSFLKVLQKVSPYGICLALGGIGFGTISTFITLYFEYLHWENGALSLTVFGVVFILCRVFFSGMIDKYGGLWVSTISLAFEAAGLLILWLAKDPVWAMAGAGVTGLGFSLVFPALGVEAVKLVSPSNKGSALAGYALFIDVSLGVTGPLIGAVASQFGMLNIFLFSMLLVFSGLIICYSIQMRTRVPEAA